ncbi:MAG: hypothetical protein WCW01_00335 [Gammaproteobacteria bacterium]
MFNTALTTLNSSIALANTSNATGCLALSEFVHQPLQTNKLIKHYQAKEYLKFQQEHHIDKTCRMREAADLLDTLESNGFVVKKFLNGQLVEIEATFPSTLPNEKHPSFWQKINNAFLRLTSFDTEKFQGETDLLNAIDEKYIEYRLQNTFLEEQEKLRTDSTRLPTNCTTLHAEVKNITMRAESGYKVNGKNYFVAYGCGVDEYYLSNLVWNILASNKIKFILHETEGITAFTQQEVVNGHVKLKYDPLYIPTPNNNLDDTTSFLFFVKDIVTGNTTEPQRVAISFEMSFGTYLVFGLAFFLTAIIVGSCVCGAIKCLCDCYTAAHEKRNNGPSITNLASAEEKKPLLPHSSPYSKPIPHKALASRQLNPSMPIGSSSAPIFGNSSLFHHVVPKAQNKSINANYVPMHT